MSDVKAVVVRLPLSEEQKTCFYSRHYTGDPTPGLLAIGTSVAGGELHPVGYINEDAIGGLAAGIYQSASIFRDEDVEHRDTVALVRMEVAQSLQASLAAAQAEIVRLRDALEDAKTFHEEQDKAFSKQPLSAQGQWHRHQHQEQIESIEEALKDGNL